jgi:hypothetical protein
MKGTSFLRASIGFAAFIVLCLASIMDSPNYGLDLIIQRLVGINTYSGNMLWIEIGI